MATRTEIMSENTRSTPDKTNYQGESDHSYLYKDKEHALRKIRKLAETLTVNSEIIEKPPHDIKDNSDDYEPVALP